ncbi:MAG: cupin domain-containing protein [Candidatus Rokuibacteriota bacterium]
MSPASGEHGQDYSELVFLYALQALPSSEVPVVEAHISACADCRQEIETLRPIIDAFASWPTEVLRPSASLRERLAQRIAAETGGAPMLPAPPRWAEPEWKEVAPGISCKLLATDTEKDRVSMMVRLAPGTDYPPHRHAGVEELYMLHGELIVDDTRFHPGDYRRGEAGTVDHRVWSETGCTCVLVTSFRDVML